MNESLIFLILKSNLQKSFLISSAKMSIIFFRYNQINKNVNLLFSHAAHTCTIKFGGKYISQLSRIV